MIEILQSSLKMEKANEYENLTNNVRYGVNLHPLWLITYLEVFGFKEVILEAREENSGVLCGLLPLVRKDIKETRYLSIRRLVPLGYLPSDFFNIITLPGREDEVTYSIANWLKDNKHDWDQLKLDLLPAESLSWDLLVKHLEALGFQPKVTTDHYFLKINTTKPYNEYLKDLGSKKLKEIRYNNNKLLKAGALEVRHIANDILHFFDDFYEVYSNRRSTVNQSDPFVRTPSLSDFLQKIIPRYEGNDWIRLSLLTLDSKIIAYAHQLIYNQVIYYYMPTFLEEYSKFSPGKVLLTELIKDAFENPAIREFNFMRTEQSYKLWHQPDREAYVKIVVNNPWSYRIRLLPFFQAISRKKHRILNRRQNLVQVRPKLENFRDLPQTI